MMTLAWNIVAKNIHPHEQLQRKLREKIGKLERHLQHFPPDTVHLHVALDRNPRKNLFTAALTLRVPSNILRSAKSASDPIPALDQAVKALLRELATFKSSLRRESAWKRTPRKQDLSATQPLRFMPVPLQPGLGPQTSDDLIRQVVQEHYTSLVHYVDRRIRHAATEAGLPAHALDPEAVADEVVQQAISRAKRKPIDQSYRFWLFWLAGRELQRRLEDFRSHAKTDIPLDAAPDSTPGWAQDEAYAAQGGFLASNDAFEPIPATAGEDLPDGHIMPPDLAASQSDLIDHLQRVSRNWDPLERSVFEHHFLEGFEPEEVAMLENLTKSQAAQVIGQVQGRLRGAVTEAMQAKSAGQLNPLGKQPSLA